MNSIKLIIAGSRSITAMKHLKKALETFNLKPEDIEEVVSGGARGPDTLGEMWADKNKIPVKVFKADWNKSGKVAGFLRNKEMAEYGDVLLCLWDGSSRGTMDMRRQMKDRDKQTYTHIV